MLEQVILVFIVVVAGQAGDRYRYEYPMKSMDECLESIDTSKIQTVEIGTNENITSSAIFCAYKEKE